MAPLRASRDLRLLILGNFVTGLGSSATLVALPYQVYVETRSPLLTGLLGLVEIGPLVTMSLLGGALADRFDRRRLLLFDQLALGGLTGALCLAAVLGHPPVAVIYVLAGLLAGASAVQNVVRTAIIPNLVEPRLMPQALALNFGLYTLTGVVGPGLGGLLIGAAGVEGAYGVDALTCLAMVGSVLALAPQLPGRSGLTHPPILRSIAEGLRFVRSNQALMGSFAIDLVAMTFGMPRALFPVLAVSVYHAGAAGTGLLFAAVAAGATVAALTTGWLEHVRRLGLVVIGAVVAWGIAIAAAGAVSALWPAAVLLALAGAADSVSAVCRSIINQTVTPDALRGRMSSVFSLVVSGGPRLGDIEAGAVASVTSARFSMASGGLACLAGTALVCLAFPALVRYDREQVLAAGQPA
ncbi:MAG: hypothetical protein QOG68_902 [Solirubrobacteraceae bacterium]|nr:hypothetical protein [Solirubrobacteraceae bacterium]